MKTFKNKRLKATLLAIAAVLTFGLTSCTDEIGSDVTTGEPGYLTINLKTLQPKQTKLLTGNADDFKKITNLNIFVFKSTGELLLNKYINDASLLNSDGTPISIPIQVSTLPAGAFVVAVANYYGEAGSEDANGKRIDDIENYAQLEAKVIPTIKDFSTTGLHMTGRGDINYTNAASYIYTATVKIAPVEAKITVKWEFEALSDALNYDVTGIYVVNAISQTTMPIILNTTTVAVTGNIVPTPATKNISLIPATPATRTALTGLAAVASRDFNFYTMNIEKDLLSDTINMVTNTTLASGFTSMAQPFHYYVGENLSNNETIPQASQGAILANNTTKSQNTLVVLRVNPKHDAPLYIRNMGARYYTYEFNKTSTGATTGQNTENLGTATDGFSVRRKTNYTLTFKLKEIGAPEPFRRVSTLTVDVQANTWDEATSGQTF